MLEIPNAQPKVTTVDIRSWQPFRSTDVSALTEAALLDRLQPVADLSAPACARLARRIMARCVVSFPFRAGANSEELVTWLTQAGAVVVLSAAARPTACATSRELRRGHPDQSERTE